MGKYLPDTPVAGWLVLIVTFAIAAGLAIEPGTSGRRWRTIGVPY